MRKRHAPLYPIKVGHKIATLPQRLESEYCLDPIGEGKRNIEVDDMRKKGPPPRVWTGEKPLPWPIAVFVDGVKINNIEAYSLIAGIIEFRSKGGTLKRIDTKPDGFLVQRLH